MLKIKENFVDRVEQSVRILKNNFLKLTLHIVLCNIFFLSVIPNTVLQLLPLESLLGGDITQKIGLYLSLGFGLGSLYILTYLFVLIPIQVSIVKSIKDAIYEEDIDTGKNLSYGFHNIASVFKTYWYIFSYVYLLPAGIFILGGLMFIATNTLSGNTLGLLQVTAGALMGISVLVFLFFALYRGTKAAFGVISAIDSQQFTKDNLHSSLQLSSGKWWRVFGNLFGIGFIIGALLQLLNFIGSLFLVFNQGWSDILTNMNSENIDVQQIIAELSNFNILSFINNIIQTSLGSALGVLVVIFSYLLFKSLQNSGVTPLEKEKTIEL